jgi:ATP-binding cassette subfamily A (ABC1) protein 3
MPVCFPGVCPQHDVLFPDLTVEQHLRLFAGLKGVPSSKIAAAVKDSITTVGLTEKVSLLLIFLHCAHDRAR